MATGTLRGLLRAVGWKLQKAGRIKARGTERDAYANTAEREALPAGVDALALAGAWLEALRRPVPPAGAKSAPIERPCKSEKSPTPAPPPAPPPRVRWPLAAAVPIPWAAGPPPPTRGYPKGFGRAPAELLAAS